MKEPRVQIWVIIVLEWHRKQRTLLTVFWKIKITGPTRGHRLWKARATPFPSQLSATSSFACRRSGTSWRFSRPPRTPPAPRRCSRCCRGSGPRLFTRNTWTRALRRRWARPTPSSALRSTPTTQSTASQPPVRPTTLSWEQRENWGQASSITGNLYWYQLSNCSCYQPSTLSSLIRKFQTHSYHLPLILCVTNMTPQASLHALPSDGQLSWPLS